MYESKTVLSNKEIARGVRYLEIDFRVDFVPGQCVTLRIERAERHYSIASRSGAERLGILYDVIDRGRLTPSLAGIGKGFAISVSKPFGEFSCDPDGPATWIATGTGVAPFVSMVRSGLKHGFTLIHGARELERFYFFGELSEALGDRYIPCLSGVQEYPNAESIPAPEGVFPGRLTDWIKSHDLAPDIPYYLCGGANMVVDVRDLLVDRGIPFGSIISEIYF